MWIMLEGTFLFKTPEELEDLDEYHLHHLASVVSLLGPPPADLLQRSETDEPWEYFDTEGESIHLATVPLRNRLTCMSAL